MKVNRRIRRATSLKANRNLWALRAELDRLRWKLIEDNMAYKPVSTAIRMMDPSIPMVQERLIENQRQLQLLRDGRAAIAVLKSKPHFVKIFNL